MQAAAFRRYWNESTFHISDDAVELNNSFRAGPDRDMQRFKHFIFHTRCDHEMVEVGLHFRAGKWTASYYVSDSLWSLSTVFRQHGVPAPQGLQTGYGFEEDVRTFSASGAFSGERKAMNPEAGLGFTAKDLCVAKYVIDQSITDWILL